MTTKEKALALMNEVREKWGLEKRQRLDLLAPTEHALYVAVELLEQEKVTHAERLLAMDARTTTAETQHEATEKELRDFKQEVSDAVEDYTDHLGVGELHFASKKLGQFIIPAPKPDPLVAVLEGVTFDHYPPNDAKTIRAALDALGFEIREKSK